MSSVLFVDDDDDTRLIVSDLLESRGDEVREATNGVEGLHALDEAYPQIVVTDVEMPVLDGPGMVLRMFVDDLGRENIPVILASGASDLPRVAEALGTPYFLAKPYSVSALFAMIDRALEEGLAPRPLSLCGQRSA